MTAAALPMDLADLTSDARRRLDAKRAVEDATDAMRARLEQGIVLAGRTWMPLRVVTFDLQLQRTQIVERAGVMPLFTAPPQSDEEATLLSAEVLRTAFASGVLYDMLAHLLVEQSPDGSPDYLPWSRSAAADRATFFMTLVDPADHERLADAVLWLVLDFFLSASASSPIFAKSLAAVASAADRRARETPERPANRRAAHPNSSRTADVSASEAISTLDGGTGSSEPSPDFAVSTP